jgi:hypothetical protein
MAAEIRLIDFQVPPAEPGWYGVICDAGNDVTTVAVYWTGREWLDYPRLPWRRSGVPFDTEEEAEEWLETQRHRS